MATEQAPRGFLLVVSTWPIKREVALLWAQPGGVEAGGGEENLERGRKPTEACKHFWAPFQNSSEVGNHESFWAEKRLMKKALFGAVRL